MHFHWQNLNDMKKVGGETVCGSSLRHGRAWLHFNQEAGFAGKTLRVEWLLGKLDLSCDLTVDGSEREVLLHVALPLLFSVYLGYSGLKWLWLWRLTGYEHRRIGFRFHSWSFWWSFWEDEMSWRATDPWWMRWSFNFKDALLGRLKYEKVVHGDLRPIRIPLPEGEYLAEAEFQTLTWKRRHWPFWPLTITKQCTEVSVLSWGGLPFEGKGENSWDCGTDGLFGYSCDGHSLIDAAVEGTRKTLENRKRYGKRDYPSPIIHEPERLVEFARYVARVALSEKKYEEDHPSSLRYELEGGLLYIHHRRNGRPQSVIVERPLSDQWPDMLKTAMLTARLNDDVCTNAGA